MESPKIERKASIDLGNGNCKWTKSFPLPIESDPFGTLIASYPASGMRVVWQQIEGLTSIRVGDDYQYGGDRVGMIKTQYPHYEGIWSYGSTLDQVILVTRNPRWAIPSFHHILSELNYAQEWSDVNEYIMNIFTKRSIMENWIKWRDLKAFSEINLWGWHIDFYMENGTQYWNDLDLKELVKNLFFFFNESNKPWPINEHCVFDIDCVPVAHVSYDKMRNPDTGVGDDYQFGGDKVGIIKTQYPHYEGIWSYGSTLDQVIIVTRNPRWAIPSFHNILSEIDYAQEWSDVNDYITNVFTRRAPMENWIKWRDLKFDSEIDLWGWHIDFYMENGTQYWNDLDFERVGEKPFFFFNESNKPWPINEHCLLDMDCVPVAHVSYDKMRNPDTGPGELSKIANILREKKGMTVLSDEAIECIWNQTWTFSTAPRNENRDISSPSASDYKFTNTQLQAMLDKLEFMKNKYNSTPWINHPIAQDLVLTFDVYIKEVAEELEYQNENPVPTPAPNPDYYQSLVDWYATVGQGDRYNVDKVRGMRGYWPLVKNFYGEE
eukprot:CAMPEP_0194160744 /NCGR_PEP_ID=MMETSP0152-20130528/78557_1 /TAXON_ID=1049557 /ORGANISM="Thalassiothrix antarctica, Strain L6-D1" /LENGTH=548 /DNA_ID=CAMNT_0038870459 /DNA_START=226 /DNA_END=1873 /DNA_ORIENTATION=-